MSSSAKWVSRQTSSAGTSPHNVDGAKSYDGFSGDPPASASDPEKELYLGHAFADDPATHHIQRFRESAVRALTAVGQTRVWNLMIDVIAQSGRYPPVATSLNHFIAEGECRLWVHVAIDRYTGEILHQQMEVVRE